jgi:hypothetical protein
MPVTSGLKKALANGLKPGVNLCEELRNYRPDKIEEVDDAAAICAALKRVREYEQACPESVDTYKSPLRDLALLFQSVGSKEVADAFREEGIPQLISEYDARIDAAMTGESDELLIVLKILGMYGSKAGVGRIANAAGRGFLPDGFMWQVVFGQIRADHPGAEYLAQELRDSIPQGFCGVAFLDCMNTAAIAGKLGSHPFDSDSGKRKLEKWLLNRDEGEFSFAHSATAALPFISNPERDRLLAIAMDHPDQGVQMEAAWASAKLGSESSIKFLARLCLDPNTSSTACRYLTELGREDAIPEDAHDEDFRATAEMCSWLAHPQEFGRPPQQIELADTRELHWPPTNDFRKVWLFKYRYPAHEKGEEDDVGYGMVGSVTFALFGEATADLSPEDVYGLHCAWELECNGDDRAPEKRTAKAGRKILASYNENFPE